MGLVSFPCISNYRCLIYWSAGKEREPLQNPPTSSRGESSKTLGDLGRSRQLANPNDHDRCNLWRYRRAVQMCDDQLESGLREL